MTAMTKYSALDHPSCGISKKRGKQKRKNPKNKKKVYAYLKIPKVVLHLLSLIP
jgi:hypothetical protein